jgi:hypothetical protein
MTPTDPKAAERMRDALELIVSNLEDKIGRARARVGSLVANVVADAEGLLERTAPTRSTPAFWRCTFASWPRRRPSWLPSANGCAS